jgi:hypothetical protein
MIHMSDVDKLNERLAKVEAERSEIKMQIAARHGEVVTGDVAPTERPADERQAELSEESRARREAASKTYPAGESPAVVEGDFVGRDDQSAAESRATTGKPSGTPHAAPKDKA